MEKKYGKMGLRDFLTMSKEEWLEFVEALERVVLDPQPDWVRAEAFLGLRGLYVFLDLEYLKYAAPHVFRKRKLYGVAIDIAEKVADMEVLAAVQPATFGLGGRDCAWPPREEGKLLKLVERCGTYEELALALMREYGPCVLIDADDHMDYALLAARPRALD
jgi:hypothetical protein